MGKETTEVELSELSGLENEIGCLYLIKSLLRRLEQLLGKIDIIVENKIYNPR